MNYQYGQIIEVRANDEAPWTRRIFLYAEGPAAAVVATIDEAIFMRGPATVRFDVFDMHRPIGVESFEAGQLVAFEFNGCHELGLYVEMSGIDRHTIEHGVGRIFVTKVWTPSIETAQQMFPQFKIEEK